MRKFTVNLKKQGIFHEMSFLTTFSLNYHLHYDVLCLKDSVFCTIWIHKQGMRINTERLCSYLENESECVWLLVHIQFLLFPQCEREILEWINVISKHL